MKNFYLPSLLSFYAIILLISSCTLEKEPEIPTGVNNIKDPVFLNIEVTPDINDNFQTKVRLNTLGNLNILQHGWVWGETMGPTLQDNKLELGSLTIDSFSTEIPGVGLDLGKIYYLRPYVSTGAETFYGPEQCSFLGVKFTINTDTEIFQGADVKFDNTTVGNCTYLWNFGDGNAVTTASPVHTFNTKGNFTVRLFATNNGCTVTRDMILKVIDDPFQDYWMDIHGGSFIMGCTDEQEPCDTVPLQSPAQESVEVPAHSVTISSFFMGKTEITQRQWMAVLGDNPSLWVSCGLDCPVELVSWNRIVDEFIPALNRKTGRVHRLPSEAEWEYAARADTNTRYPGSDNIDSVAWYFILGTENQPHPVAQKSPNKFGLYDMAGNMWEFVEDDFHVNYEGAPADGSAWIESPREAQRMARGGSWGSSAHRSRIAIRDNFEVEDAEDSWGFRLARSK